ncbi:MAG: tetratricopeptide repeat protein [Sphingobacteriaceae bacterium]|nr:tetratricopeptide repeat protein [Sphingobacteriaceae bacterium]
MNNEINNSRLAQLFALLSEQPQEVFLHYAIASEYKKAQHWEEAVQWFQKTVQLTPNYIAAYYQMAEAFEASGQREAAKNSLETGLHYAQGAKDLKSISEFKNALMNLDIED